MRNGAVYTANKSLTYEVGITYHFRFVVRVSEHTYDVYVTPAQSQEITLATKATFRNEQSAVTSLSNWAVAASTGNHTVCKFTITPAPPPPPTPVKADFTASPQSGPAPLAVKFTDASQGNPTGWAWDFDNNGTTDSNDWNPSYTYNTPGTYTVKLTVSGPGGTDTKKQSDYITVAPTPPLPTQQRPLILVHGWNANETTWNKYTDFKDGFLQSIGFDNIVAVHLDTGANGTIYKTIDENAKKLRDEIKKVKEQTGAKEVDVVAHSMGGLITRRYIAKYMHERDIHQLIMLGTPNGGSVTAENCDLSLSSLVQFNPLKPVTLLLVCPHYPDMTELTPSFLDTFNRDNILRLGVKFYAVAGNYACPTVKSFPLNPLEPSPNDIIVARGSAFHMPLDGAWTFPGKDKAACDAEHRDLPKNEQVFKRYIAPLLQGRQPYLPPEPQFVNILREQNLQSGEAQAMDDTLSAVQFTDVQTGQLQLGSRLEFNRTPEPGASFSFIVVGRPDQMTVSLRDLSGRAITPNTSDPSVQYMQMDKDFMPITSYTISNPVAGSWTTIVEANAQTPSEGVSVAALGSLVSNVRLTIPVDSNTPQVLHPVIITAQLSAISNPIHGAKRKRTLDLTRRCNGYNHPA